MTGHGGCGAGVSEVLGPYGGDAGRYRVHQSGGAVDDPTQLLRERISRDDGWVTLTRNARQQQACVRMSVAAGGHA
jgi:hypothetical protein